MQLTLDEKCLVASNEEHETRFKKSEQQHNYIITAICLVLGLDIRQRDGYWIGRTILGIIFLASCYYTLGYIFVIT